MIVSIYNERSNFARNRKEKFSKNGFAVKKRWRMRLGGWGGRIRLILSELLIIKKVVSIKCYTLTLTLYLLMMVIRSEH